MVIVPPLSERASFVYSASLGERVEFICFTAFLFSSWSGVSFVLIGFIATLASSIDNEESVLGVIASCSGEPLTLKTLHLCPVSCVRDTLSVPVEAVRGSLSF